MTVYDFRQLSRILTEFWQTGGPSDDWASWDTQRRLAEMVLRTLPAQQARAVQSNPQNHVTEIQKSLEDLVSSDLVARTLADKLMKCISPPSKKEVSKQSGSCPSLPPAIYSRLQSTLLECGPLNNHESLKAVFVDARISPWRSRLPEVNTEADRIAQVIDFLIARRNTRKENALVLFLQVLRDRSDPEDVCHEQLAELVNDTERLLKS